MQKIAGKFTPFLVKGAGVRRGVTTCYALSFNVRKEQENTSSALFSLNGFSDGAIHFIQD
jgi:hypothetical protein